MKTQARDNPNDLERQLSRMIGEVSRAWRFQINQRLKPFGLNLSMRRVLIELQTSEQGIMQRDLALRLGIEGPTLVRLLDNMEKTKWIRRIASADDKRCKFAVLTPKATRQMAAIEKQSDELRAEMMQDLSQEELKIAMQAMAKMAKNLKE
jgi:MarR family transcriptional regulator for hemolysin